MPMSLSDKRFLLLGVGVVAALMVIALVNLYQAKIAGPHISTLSYSEFLDDVERGQVGSVTMSGHSIVGAFTNRSAFRTFAPDDPELVRILRAKAVALSVVAAPEARSSWLTPLSNLLPMI